MRPCRIPGVGGPGGNVAGHARLSSDPRTRPDGEMPPNPRLPRQYRAIAHGRAARDADLRDHLRAGTVAHASRFSWANTATRVMETLADEAMGRHRLRSGRSA